MSVFKQIVKLLSGRRQRPSIDGRRILGRYDAAQTTEQNAQHWSATDSYDADAANSKTVRKILRDRSRYEINNNGYAKGVILTHANYVVGRGPKLRLQTRSRGANAMVEAAWNRWAKEVQFARKLRTVYKAKTGDGEGFLVIRANPGLRDLVKIDVVPVEADQISSLSVPYGERNKIDGVKYDEFGNPLYYELLRYHPGASGAWFPQEVEQISAKYVLHVFREDRPNQHRGIPEITATLGLFAAARRFREATIAAAETAADFAAVLKTNGPPNEEPDEVRPFTSIPLDKRAMTALPYQWEMQQLKPEHPSTTYDTFIRALLCEQARPLNMPYNIAACDSSGYSFSGGRLDHLTYFVAVDVEQAELEEDVCDPLFEVWFSEARRVYGWSFETDFPPPPHTWDWPARPQIDDQKTAGARQTNLSTGVVSLRRIYAEDGYDFEDELNALAEDYGVTPDKMREILLEVNLLSRIRGASQSVPVPEGDEEEAAAAGSGNGRANGNGRFRL